LSILPRDWKMDEAELLRAVSADVSKSVREVNKIG
jgi:hypothetical protein